MRVSLATKISVAVIGVLVLALVSSVVAIVSAYQFEALQKTLVEDNIESVRAAEEVEIALLEQRGYVSYYILDNGNARWLEPLDRHLKEFAYWLDRAHAAARSDEEREILDQLEDVQRAYASKRIEVIRLYDAGQTEKARQTLLSDVTTLYQEAYECCEAYILTNQRIVDDASRGVRQRVKRITVVVTATLAITLCLGAALLWLFFQGVVFPLRRMASEVRNLAGSRRQEMGDAGADEMRELGHYVRLLMTDVAETRSDLEHSRTQLAHADKLAAVGRLAAGVAHEIRNPLTAIKMWLYSLRRSVGQNGEAQQKLDVVSEELARLERIVRNFLEFARPPQLRLRPQPIAPLVDKTLELLRYRLEEAGITMDRCDAIELPHVLADTEQLKEVLLNLMINSIEAMPAGGRIAVSCSRSMHGGQEMVAVRVADSGTGIPEDVRQRIFEPFFSTKEEGTGLGLCIAASVMARHGGVLELESSSPQGTQWTVWIPTVEA